MYIVKFKRKDHKPDEDYYYNTKEEAKAHFELFIDDNSDLYDEILLIYWNNDFKVLSSIKK